MSDAEQVLALDLGSKHLGMVSAPPTLPLRPSARWTQDVDPANLDPAVGTVAAVLNTGKIGTVVLEIAPRFFAPKGASEPAKAAMLEAYTVCRVLAERVELLCREHEPPIPYERVSRQRWAHRVVPHARGITEEAGHAGVKVRTDPGLWAILRGEHERDAAGALVGYLLGLEVDRAKEARRAKRGPRAVARATDDAPAPRAADLMVDALRAHGRPIRADVLAVRLAITVSALSSMLRPALKTGRVVRPSRGIYALP